MADKVAKLRLILESTPIVGKFALEHIGDGIRTAKTGFYCQVKADSAFSRVDDRFFQFPNYPLTNTLTEEDIRRIKQHYGPYNAEDQSKNTVPKKQVTWGDWASLICRTEVKHRRSLMSAVLARHIELIDDHTFSWRPPIAKSWFFPPKGFKKLNTDASVVKLGPESSLVYLSMVVTDEDGQLIDWQAIRYEDSFGLPLEAMDGEILALYHGIGLLDSLGIHKAFLESDSIEVENVIRGKFSNSPRLEYRHLSSELKARFDNSRHRFEFRRISRDENVIADQICRKKRKTKMGDNEITHGVLDVLEEHRSNGVNIVFPPKKKSR